MQISKNAMASVVICCLFGQLLAEHQAQQLAQQRALEEQVKQAELMRQQQVTLLEQQRQQEQLVRQMVEQQERDAENARLDRA